MNRKNKLQRITVAAALRRVLKPSSKPASKSVSKQLPEHVESDTTYVKATIPHILTAHMPLLQMNEYENITILVRPFVNFFSDFIFINSATNRFFDKYVSFCKFQESMP